LTLVRCLLDSFDRGVALCVRGQTGRALEPMLGTIAPGGIDSLHVR
jgi:hypothetical protein